MKKKAISVLLILFTMLNLVFPIFSFGNDEKNKLLTENKENSNTSNVSSVFSQSKEEDDTSNYTEEYKKWLELPEEEREKWEVIPRKYKVPFNVLYEEETPNSTTYNSKLRKNIVTKSAEEEQLPKKFDLRDKIEIPVRNQESYGLCWDFASVKSLETYLALNGYGNYDFSELHVDYLESDEFGKFYKLHDGRNFEDFEDYLSNNYGPVLESEVPYDAIYTLDEYDYLLNLKNKAFVGNTINFPSINKAYGEYKIEELDLLRKKVKEHIMKNGSLYCTIRATDDNDLPNIKWYNGKLVLNYQGEGYINHAVSIIGWDDEFSKENFPEDCRPKENGAYIAMNSWGEGMTDGIFYISYEDVLVESDLNGITNASTSIEDTLEKVQFEDINLYNVIKEKLGRKIAKCDDETLTIYVSKLVLKNVRNLELENKNISSLKGIEKFTGLTSLNLANNNIENIDYLTNLNNDYMWIDLTNNKVRDVSALCNFGSINTSKNPIETGLDKLTKVNTLYLDGCNLTDLQLEQISELSNLWDIILSNNKIEDVSCLKNLNLYNIDLSGNKGIKGIEELTKIQQLILKDCSLDNSVLTKFKNIKELNFLDLSNNNITDVSELKELNIYNLDLSGNKGIQLNTIPTKLNVEIQEDEYYGEFVTSLRLENCNIEDISALKNTNISYIYLANNPISDVTPLKDNESVSYVDFSNTSVSDVSPLNKAKTIILNGNKNLTNLDKMENVTMLYLEECSISDYSFISSLKNLGEIYLKNNNIKEFPKITSESLWLINISDNKLTKLPDFSDTKISNIYLSNNEIIDISNIESMIDVQLDYAYIDLTNNKIIEVPEITKEQINIDVSKNYISDIPENNYVMYSEQEITSNYELAVNKDNRIPFTELLKSEYKKRYKTNLKLITENCSIDYKTGEIIINPKELGTGYASVTLSSDSWNCKSNGTKFNINFETKENINISHLELGNSKYKEAYLEDENFDNSNLIIKAVYENGLSYIIQDYEIVNGQELQQNQDSVKIKYDGKELDVPIVVFSKDNYDFEFNVELYCAIDELINMDIMYAKVNNDKVRCIIKKEAIDNLTKLDLSHFEIENFTGLSNLYNLKELDLSDMYIRDQGNLFDEICKLYNLEQLILNNSDYWGTGYWAKGDLIREVLKLPNIQLIDFGERSFTSHGYIEDRKYELPKYLTEDDVENINVTVTYKNSNDEEIKENLPIYVDDNKNLYVIHDTEVTENKKYAERVMNIDISTNKIKQKINYTYEWELDTDKPTVEITGESLLHIDGNKDSLQLLATNSNSVVYTFTWSENVYGFTKDSIIVENGKKGEFIEVTPNQVYTLVVTNDVEENKEGTQTITIGENACTDLAGNGNTEVTQPIIIDRSAPNIKISDDIIVGQEITIEFEDLGNVTGWQITDLENEPQEWRTDTTNNKATYIVEKGTKYIWAKDALNHISHKAIISKEISDKIEVKEYTLQDNIIKYVKENTTISNFKKNIVIEDFSYKILSKDDKELKENDIITTGSKIDITINNEKTQFIISVTGDTTGDGHADIKDILSMNKHRLNKAKLENEYFEAGDINKDGTIDIKDIFQLNKFRLGKINSL